MSDGDAGGSDATPAQVPDADADLLLRLQFGPSVPDSIRRRLVRHAKRLLRRDDAAALGERGDGKRQRHHADRYSRKRRRADTDSDLSDEYEPDRGGRRSGADCTLDRAQSIVLYSGAAGFDLDAARGDSSDAEVRYEHGTLAVVGLTADSRQALGNPCFNCAIPGHELRDCPMPVDEDRVDASRRAFREKGSGQFSGRLHLAVEDERRTSEMRERLRPGLPLSDELCAALGMESSDEIPAYVDSMYIYGYPPAYLGHDAGQDPLHARPVTGPLPPATPSLHVYHDAADFDHAHGAPSDECPGKDDGTAQDGGAKASTQISAKSDDEEGAVSDGELDAKGNDAGGDSPVQARTIPLVHYTGLDLKQFDFDSPEHPGRPLRAHNPGRPAYASYTATPRTGRHAGGGHRYRDRDWEQYSHGQSGNGQNGYNQEPYPAPYPAPYLPAPPYADGWGGMLAGYYGALGRGGSETPHGPNGYSMPPWADMYCEQRASNRRASILRATAPSPQTPASYRYASQPVESGPTATRGATAAPESPPPAAPRSPGPANTDGELEDGECDMEVSE